MTDKARVIITDKNALVLTGLRTLLEEDGRFDVVATAEDGRAFVEMAQTVPCDVGVIGWEMPRMDGRAVLDALAEWADAPKMVVYTGVPGPRVVREAMLHGAAGFCHKGETNKALLDAIAGVAEGRMVFPFTDLRRLADDPWEALTQREMELLDALKTGRANKQIAADMGISENTVKFHLKNLYAKLGVKNRAQVVALAISRGARS